MHRNVIAYVVSLKANEDISIVRLGTLTGFATLPVSLACIKKRTIISRLCISSLIRLLGICAKSFEEAQLSTCSFPLSKSPIDFFRGIVDL
jgi:hypothetical protein